MNILEQHIDELHKAQEEFNRGIARVHEVYAEAVQRSRDKLLAALNGVPLPTVPGEPFESLPEARPMLPVDMSALEREIDEEIGADRSWKYWMDAPPPLNMALEIQRDGEDEIRVLTSTASVSPHFNVAGLRWRKP